MKLPSGIDLSSKNLRNLERLIQQISQENSCAFIGAGLSYGAGYPLWREVIEKLQNKAKEITGNKIEFENDRNWDRIEQLRNIIGEEYYKEELLQLFGPKDKYDFLPVHSLINSIPFLSCITTNYDYCLENAASVIGKQVTVQFYPELYIKHLLEHHHIYHIHGVIEPEYPERSFGTVILSKRDYDSAYKINSRLSRFLADLYLSCSLVFIGYSLSDVALVSVINNTKMELAQQIENELRSGIGKRIKTEHFIILHKESFIDEVALSELNLIPIYYTGEDVKHSELQNLLKYIQEKTSKELKPKPLIYRGMFEDNYHV